MPIVDVESIGRIRAGRRKAPAQALADRLGAVFGSPAGRTWIRLRVTPAAGYAENGIRVDASALPVFVTVLHAHPPRGRALAAEVEAITRVVAACLLRPVDRVHVQYAAPGAGRQAFGGALVR